MTIINKDISTDLAERVATALRIGLGDACPNDPIEGEGGHRRWIKRIQEWADWIHEQYAPHLMDFLGPDRWTDDGDSSQPEWSTCCDTLTAWPQGVETEDGFVDIADLGKLRAPAIKVLAACNAAEQLSVGATAQDAED